MSMDEAAISQGEREEEYRMQLEEARRENIARALDPITQAANKLHHQIKRAQGVINSVVAIILAAFKELFDIYSEKVVAEITLAVAAIPGLGLVMGPAVGISLQIGVFFAGLFLSGIVNLYLWRVGLMPKGASRYGKLIVSFVGDNIPGINALPLSLVVVIYAIVERFLQAQPKKIKLRELRKKKKVLERELNATA